MLKSIYFLLLSLQDLRASSKKLAEQTSPKAKDGSQQGQDGEDKEEVDDESAARQR